MAKASYDIQIVSERPPERALFLVSAFDRRGELLSNVAVHFSIEGVAVSVDDARVVKEITETTDSDGEACVVWIGSPRAGPPRRLISTLVARL